MKNKTVNSKLIFLLLFTVKNYIPVIKYMLFIGTELSSTAKMVIMIILFLLLSLLLKVDVYFKHK